jgi:hypothetical protein
MSRQRLDLPNIRPVLEQMRISRRTCSSNRG